MIALPAPLARCPWASRLTVAVQATTSAGAALMSLRGAGVRAEEVGSQLKTSVDLAAEGWVLGLIHGTFGGDRFLAEESYAASGQWEAQAAPYWTVDALDGTRSYVEGYPGFCVQVAFVEAGRPVFGVIAEPFASRCYVAVDGQGAWELTAAGYRELSRRKLEGWPRSPRFVDSTVPGGKVGELFKAHGGQFLECGSVGLKACRVAADEADVYAKAFRFKLWDVAPAEVLARETGCRLCLWSGQRIDYGAARVEYADLVMAPDGLIDHLLPLAPPA